MAHAVETMAYAGETPWHGLGKRVLADLTPEQMLKEAGLDWEVQLLPTFVKLPWLKGKQVQTADRALVRSTDGSVLTTVGGRWHPTQNAEAFDVFHDFVMSGNMEMHTAGALHNGKIVWALAKIKDQTVEVVKDDVIENYMLFTNPHIFGRCIEYGQTAVRVVCQNTLRMALSAGAGSMSRITHRSAFDAEAVKSTMAASMQNLQNYRDAGKLLAKKKMKDESYSEYLRRLFPVMGPNAKAANEEGQMSRSAESVLKLLETQPGNQFARGSWWQGFNAVTFHLDHKYGRTQDARVASAWYGPNRTLKQQALELATEYANAA